MISSNYDPKLKGQISEDVLLQCFKYKGSYFADF